jgi:ABC-2 type transport system ATP-binding protein
MEASIILKKVGKLSGEKTILAGLSFGIEKGSLVAIVGDNEAGKSTLLRVLAGVENQEYGSVYVHGLDTIKRRPDTSRLIGYVPFENDLDPWLTIEQNCRFMGYLYGLNDAEISKRLGLYAPQLALEEYLSKSVKTVSPGLLKKAMLLRALIHEPELLILDEPTAYMDAESFRQTWNLLKSFHGNKTVLYVSQSLPEVEAAHDRILVIQDGKIVLDGHLDRLLESTFEFHQFRLDFESLTEDLYSKLAAVPHVKKPSRIGDSFLFYGSSRKVLFEVLKQAADGILVDLNLKKLGLQDLLDAKSAREGIE